MKKSRPVRLSRNVKTFIQDISILYSLPVSKKDSGIYLDEFPFDAQLLKLSPLYRISRMHYLSIGGKFSPRVSSMLRSLRAQDLFKDQIDYTPSLSEMIWFKDHAQEVTDPNAEVKALQQFNENSVFHEQNHRVIWRLLPPAPKNPAAFRRYLNFAESLVVTLDCALGDEIGVRLSAPLERMNVIYRPGGHHSYSNKPKGLYRKYLLSLLCSTYYALELIHHDDILKAVDYIFPEQKSMNKKAVQRGLELSELFTKNTNPQWQKLYWKSAQKSLARLHKGRTESAFIIAEDPLDLGLEFSYARAIFDFYKI